MLCDSLSEEVVHSWITTDLERDSTCFRIICGRATGGVGDVPSGAVWITALTTSAIYGQECHLCYPAQHSCRRQALTTSVIYGEKCVLMKTSATYIRVRFETLRHSITAGADYSCHL